MNASELEITGWEPLLALLYAATIAVLMVVVYLFLTAVAVWGVRVRRNWGAAKRPLI